MEFPAIPWAPVNAARRGFKVGTGVANLNFERNLTTMAGFGKTLIVVGVVLVVVGLLFAFVGKLPWLGNLPGDIKVERNGFSFYFPITTCVFISAIVSLVVYFLRR